MMETVPSNLIASHCEKLLWILHHCIFLTKMPYLKSPLNLSSSNLRTSIESSPHDKCIQGSATVIWTAGDLSFFSATISNLEIC